MAVSLSLRAGIITRLHSSLVPLTARWAGCLTPPSPSRRLINVTAIAARRAHPGNGFLILAVPSPRLRGWPFRFLPLYTASNFGSSFAVGSRRAFLSVDSLSRIAVHLAPSDHLSLIQFLTSCDVLSNRSTRGERDYAS
jgi:hypothetical protein